MSKLEIRARRRNPYYIYAPDYTDASSGIRVMHYLCHCLRLIGEEAYLVTGKLNLNLNTGFLTSDIRQQHREADVSPIVIYPEVVLGNPEGASTVVRYLLNKPGLIGGAKELSDNELVYTYKAEFLPAGVSAPQLYLPTSDLSVFNPSDDLCRHEILFFVGRAKKKLLTMGLLNQHPVGAIEISYDCPRSLEELAALFKRGKMLYAYEPSAVCTEAMLCGCPVTYIPNPFYDFNNFIPSQELFGNNGTTVLGRGDSDAQSARDTVGEIYAIYSKLKEDFWSALPRFVDHTQNVAAETSKSGCRYIAKSISDDQVVVPKASPPLSILGGSKASGGATFDVVVRGLEVNENQFAVTMRDLDKQYVKPHMVRKVASSSLEHVNAISLQGAAEWIVFLRSGDICDPLFLAVLTRSVGSHLEWVAAYLDENQLGKDGEIASHHFKPDFNLDYLRSLPYVGNTFAVRRDVFGQIGGFDESYEGIEELDFFFRLFERFGATAIGHISGAMISHSDGNELSRLPLDQVLECGRNAIKAHLRRLQTDAEVEHGALPATYRVRYIQHNKPLVSIIISTRNGRVTLDRCIQSLFARTGWPEFEIVIVDGRSDDAETMEFLGGLRELGRELQDRIRVFDYLKPFNYSAMQNIGASEARGEYLLFLHDDVEALHPEWLESMMSHAQRADVGAVGAKLLFADGKIENAGVVLGVRGPAGRVFVGHDAREPGYFARLQVDQNYSAISGACLLTSRALFEEVGAFDESELGLCYGDVDYCLKVRAKGYLVVWTPHAILLHEGVAEQDADVEPGERGTGGKHCKRERAVMYDRWLPNMVNDVAYNRFLALDSIDFQVESDEALRWDPAWRPAPRIIAQPADRMGCGEYRIIAPSRALINAGRIQGLESGRIYTPPELARIAPDALVLQRQIEPHQIDAIDRHKRFNDVFCVFEIDDLVTNAPVKNAHKKHLPKDIYKRLRRAAGACDRLVVATDMLAEAYGDLNTDVRVIPNFIEEARWGGFEPSRRVSRKPRVGWAGGVSHTGDLELIEGVVEALKDEVDWVFFGMCPDRLRPYVHEFHEPVAIDLYAHHLASLNLDLAVAPLEDVPFNHAKSHLRLLEYGILGYPVVCSDLTPYQGGYPVTRVRNRFLDWVDAIRGHINDLDATAEQGDALRHHVRERWLLENNLDSWLQAWLP